MQKQLLITFDYELFLGTKSGSVDDCMIFPTRKLLQILNKYNIRAIFFVDTVYLLRLKEMMSEHASCHEDFNKVSEQLCEIIEIGHFVFPHIHPHWLDAIYSTETKCWSLSNTNKYRFHNISSEEKEIVFGGSIRLLKSIIHPRFPEYTIDAHRAGGWCIQPFSDYKPYYEKYGINYDFSVLGGFYQFTQAQYFDFTKAPVKNIYNFRTNVNEEISNGPFTQFNISSIKIDPLLDFFNKIWLKYQYNLLGDHTFERGIGQDAKELQGIEPENATGKNFGNTNWERISVEHMTGVKLPNYIQFLDHNKYMHFLSHPKMITNHNLSIFDKFLEKVFDKYSIETDFHLMIP